jgi:hypothetical protein
MCKTPLEIRAIWNLVTLEENFGVQVLSFYFFLAARFFPVLSSMHARASMVPVVHADAVAGHDEPIRRVLLNREYQRASPFVRLNKSLIW